MVRKKTYTEYYDDVTNEYNVSMIASWYRYTFGENSASGIDYTLTYIPYREEVVAVIEVEIGDISLESVKHDLEIIARTYQEDFITDEEYEEEVENFGEIDLEKEFPKVKIKKERDMWGR